VELHHGELSLRTVVRERDAEVSGKEGDLSLKVASCAGQVVGLLFQVVPLAPNWLGVGCDLVYDRVVALQERGEELVAKTPPACVARVVGGLLHLCEQVAHRLSPAGLIPADADRGEIANQVGSTYPMACTGVVFLWSYGQIASYTVDVDHLAIGESETEKILSVLDAIAAEVSGLIPLYRAGIELTTHPDTPPDTPA